MLSLAVKFIFPVRKVVGNIEAARFAEDVEYRHDIFEKILSIDVADLMRWHLIYALNLI